VEGEKKLLFGGLKRGLLFPIRDSNWNYTTQYIAL